MATYDELLKRREEIDNRLSYILSRTQAGAGAEYNTLRQEELSLRNERRSIGDRLKDITASRVLNISESEAASQRETAIARWRSTNEPGAAKAPASVMARTLDGWQPVVSAVIDGKRVVGAESFVQQKAEALYLQTRTQDAQRLQAQGYGSAAAVFAATPRYEVVGDGGRAYARKPTQERYVGAAAKRQAESATAVMAATPTPVADNRGRLARAYGAVSNVFNRGDEAAKRYFERRGSPELSVAREQGAFFMRAGDYLEGRADDMRAQLPTSGVLRTAGQVVQIVPRTNLRILGVASKFVGGKLAAYSDRPVSTAALTATEYGLYRRTGGFALKLLRGAVGGTLLAPSEVMSYRGYNAPVSMKPYLGDSRLQSAVTRSTDTEPLRDALSNLGSFRARVRTDLQAQGLTGERLNAAVDAAAYERRTRSYAVGAALVAGSEPLGNLGGSVAYAKYSKYLWPARQSYNARFLRAGTAIALGGGTLEGASQVVAVSRVERRPINAKEVAVGAGAGALFSFVPGGLYVAGQTSKASMRLGRGAVRSGLREQTKYGIGQSSTIYSYVTDLPEYPGDLWSELIDNRGPRTRVYAPSTSQRYTGAYTDVSYSAVTNNNGASVRDVGMYRGSYVNMRVPVVVNGDAIQYAPSFVNQPVQPSRPSRARSSVPSRVINEVYNPTNVFTYSNVFSPVPVRSNVPASAPVNSFVQVSPRVTVPTGRLLLPVPPMLGGGGGGWRWPRRVVRRQPLGYTPSAYALGLNIVGRKPGARALRTGFAVRPIIVKRIRRVSMLG